MSSPLIPNFYYVYGVNFKNPKRAEAILKQAERQIKAVDGKVKIEWHVSTELGAKGIQKLFKTQDPPIKIDVKYIKKLFKFNSKLI